MLFFNAVQVILRNILTGYYRITVRPSDDFDRNLLYKMVWDRRPILEILNEKVASRQYVQSVAPEVPLAHRYFQTKNLSEIDWESLPRNFVIKASHGSGGVLLVHDGAPLKNRLPKNYKKFGWRKYEIHPDNFEREIAIKIFSRLLSKTYGQGLNRGGPEWAYWHNNHYVIIEDFLSLHGRMPVSIVFNIVHGELKLIIWAQVHYPRLGAAESLPSRVIVPPVDIAEISKELQIPTESLKEMIDCSIQISGDMDTLRVDWLICDNGFFFNELTNYCGGGVLKGKHYYKAMSDMWRPKRSDYQQLVAGEAHENDYY